MTGAEKQSFLSLDPMTVNQCYCHVKHVIIIFFSFYCKTIFSSNSSRLKILKFTIALVKMITQKKKVHLSCARVKSLETS